MKKSYSNRSNARRAAAKYYNSLDGVQFKQLDDGTWIGYDAGIVDSYGVEYCPHCGIHLSNGVGHHGDRAQHSTHELECLACGGEFGSPLKPVNGSDQEGKWQKKDFSNRPHGTVRQTIFDYADELTAAGLARKEAVSEMVARGIARNSASKGYSEWLKARKDAEAK